MRISWVNTLAKNYHPKFPKKMKINSKTGSTEIQMGSNSISFYQEIDKSARAVI